MTNNESLAPPTPASFLLSLYLFTVRYTEAFTTSRARLYRATSLSLYIHITVHIELDLYRLTVVHHPNAAASRLNSGAFCFRVLEKERKSHKINVLTTFDESDAENVAR